VSDFPALAPAAVPGPPASPAPTPALELAAPPAALNRDPGPTVALGVALTPAVPGPGRGVLPEPTPPVAKGEKGR
jgi:hypothetical protein